MKPPHNKRIQMKKRVIDGELCCGIADAARYLKTNNQTVKKLIGNGKIQLGPQPRVNCQKQYVRVDSIINLKYATQKT